MVRKAGRKSAAVVYIYEDASNTKPFTRAIHGKGWSIPDLAARWGITARRCQQIACNPTQRELDAVVGLPDRTFDHFFNRPPEPPKCSEPLQAQDAGWETQYPWQVGRIIDVNGRK